LCWRKIEKCGGMILARAFCLAWDLAWGSAWEP